MEELERLLRESIEDFQRLNGRLPNPAEVDDMWEVIKPPPSFMERLAGVGRDAFLSAAGTAGPFSTFPQATLQFGRGLLESGLTTAEGLGRIAQLETIPDVLRRTRDTTLLEAFGEPADLPSTLGRITGRIGGDITQAFLPGAGLTRLGLIPKATTAGRAFLQNFLAGAPFDVAVSAAGPETSMLGFAGEALGSPQMQEAAESLPLRVGTEVLAGAGLAGAITSIGRPTAHAERLLREFTEHIIAPISDITHSRGWRAAVETIEEARPELTESMRRLSTAAGIGEINITELPRIIESYGIGPGEGGMIFQRLFNQADDIKAVMPLRAELSKLSLQELDKLGLGQLYMPDSHFARLRGWGRGLRSDILDVWRASITSALSTANRNLLSGTARTAGEFFEQTAVASIRAMSGRMPWPVAIKSSLQSLTSIYASLTPSGKKLWNNIMLMLPEDPDAAINLRVQREVAGLRGAGKVEEFPAKLRPARTAFERIYGSPVFDVAGPKVRGTTARGITQFLQTLNRTQEYIVRRAAFAGHYGRRLYELGLDPEGFHSLAQREGFSNLPEDMQRAFATAADEGGLRALDVTFALGPKEFRQLKTPPAVMGRRLLRFYNRIPEAALIHPFPRFLAASTHFLWERNPFIPLIMAGKKIGKTGSFLGPEFWKSIAREPEEAIMKFVRGSEGLLGLAAGLAFRLSPLAGPEWYQVRRGEDSKGRPRHIDMRPVMPLSAFLLVGEGLRWALAKLEPETFGSTETRITGKELLQAATGIRRYTGSGLFVLESFAEARTTDDAWRGFERFLQAVLGGFSTGGRTFKEILSQVDADEGVFKDLESPVELGEGVEIPPVFNEFLSNIPVLGSALLPPAPSPTRATPRGFEELIGGFAPGIFRQTAGLSITTETPVEALIKKFDLRAPTATGIPLLDRRTDEILGAIVERSQLDQRVQGPDFQALDRERQQMVLAEALSTLRSVAKAQAIRADPRGMLDAIVKELLDTPEDRRLLRLRNLDIPAELKSVVLQVITTPLSITGQSIPALRGLSTAEEGFVLQALPARARSFPRE